MSRTAYGFPCIFRMIARGELHLGGVHQLAGHLTEENHEKVLRRRKGDRDPAGAGPDTDAGPDATTDADTDARRRGLGARRGLWGRSQR